MGRSSSSPDCVSIFARMRFAAVITARPRLNDPDLWWHLRNAQVLLTTHHFIRQDFYSFTTVGQPWINPEWLAEIPYYLAFRIFAERGVFLMMIVALCSSFPVKVKW